MTKHSIVLPKPIADYLERRVADGQHGSVSDYIVDLVGRDMTERQEAAATLRTLLDEAEASGISERSLDEILDHARSAGRKSAGAA